MPKFSERLGVTKVARQIQVESINEELRNSLWNSVLARFAPRTTTDRSRWADVARALSKYHFKVPVDALPDSSSAKLAWVRDHFFGADWAGVYDLIEFLAANVDSIQNPTNDSRYYDSQQRQFIVELNGVLERELSGYRFIKGVLSPVSDPVEVTAIEAAASHISNSSLAAPSQHIRAALEFLGRKPTPDYRNSIKESISAVESVVSRIAGTDPGGVAKAIDDVAGKVEMHGALKAALKQLYGYSSDEDGIRHAIMDHSTVGYDEAKFMLVACSAFVNFLVAKANAAGVLR